MLTDAQPNAGVETPSDFERIARGLRYRRGHLTTRWQTMNLRSVLQPVFSVRHQRPIGCEALIRGSGDGDEEIPPWRIFATATSEDALHLDRRCAALHCHNFAAIAGASQWLFLNLHPAEFIQQAWDDGFFRSLIDETKLNPGQIVFEILETPIPEHVELAEAIAHLRGLGALVALDDFGAGHSNFERIWRLKPDIVKLDRALLLYAEQDPIMRRSFGSIVEILHQNRCLVVAEGIETEAQALLAIDANVDLVQGYYFSRPFEISGALGESAVDWRALESTLKARDEGSFAFKRPFLAHIAKLHEIAAAVARGADFANAAGALFEFEDVLRCYAIDGDGRQRQANLPSPHVARIADPRLAPLAGAEGASWYHRPYFRRAKTQPGEVQVSREYLSCTDALLCTTLSIAVDAPEGQKILCCDLQAE
ncbi:MAG: EAL domain-containing protein [Gammaproteobacteria bacterium]|nr:EAL domain-containing protein [Gammaproteobacteria bacterium]MBI5616689.1 EAL domain-containing protein [Gammaproteobacteria bacterium]